MRSIDWTASVNPRLNSAELAVNRARSSATSGIATLLFVVLVIFVLHHERAGVLRVDLRGRIRAHRDERDLVEGHVGEMANVAVEVPGHRIEPDRQIGDDAVPEKSHGLAALL